MNAFKANWQTMRMEAPVQVCKKDMNKTDMHEYTVVETEVFD